MTTQGVDVTEWTGSPELHLVACPDRGCGAPAEVLDEWRLPSTDGPVTLLRTLCARRHAFTAPVPSPQIPGAPLVPHHPERTITMPVASNDAGVLLVETKDQDGTAGNPFEVRVTAEAGAALHGTGGEYRIRMTLTDTTDPALLDSQEIVANFGGPQWVSAGLNAFTFTVPAAATVGRAGNIVQPQARLIVNAAPPFDASHVIGTPLLLTP